jgi:DNA helicase-2/ATP-dependent DNA helicase PcrA
MATTPHFDQAYKRLNPEQKKAVDTVEGAVMVVAGPGTGKTQILTLRIANILLNTDTNPESILALTFTESGVAAMRKRLVEMIGSAGYKVYITTFHGFSNDVIRNNPENFRHLAGREPITDLDQIQILEEILLESDLKYLKPFGDPIFYTKSVLAAINDLKKEDVSPEEFAVAVKEQVRDFGEIGDKIYEKGPYKGKMKGKYGDLQKIINKNEELIKVYEMYQKVLEKRKFYDYSDMIMEVSNALQKDEELRLSLQERYLYILVDEHQDTNFAQNKILESLATYFENPNLFIVGDEKQAIYRFQGASLENFLYFKKLYPEAVLINLEKNYRSTQAVLDASGSLISKNIVPEEFNNSIKLMSTVEYPSEKIKIAGFNSPFSELKFVSEDISEKIKSGVEPREIAVIYRNNKDVFPLVQVLDQVGVQYYIESDQDLLSDIEVRKALDILKAVANLGEDQYLTPLLHMDFFGIPPLDIFKLIKFSRKNRISLFEILNDPVKHEALILEDGEAMKKLYQDLCKWMKQSKNDSLENLYITILQQSGMLKKVLESPKSLEKMDHLATLYSEIRNYTLRNSEATIEGFLNYVQLLKDHQLLIKKPIKNPLQKSIRLMTAHRSKGLEFEYVYIINVYEGHWGNKRSSRLIKLPWEFLGNREKLGEVIDGNEDERRLFYVAMTRAKKQVMITYAAISEDGREQLPSQFIEEIEPEYKEQVDVSEFEGKLQIKPEQLFLISEPKADFKDKDFFNFIFQQEGLSVTGLNNYLDCPWKYFYLNLVQIPMVKERPQVYGMAIHNALCELVRVIRGIGEKERAVKFTLDIYKKYLDGEELSNKDYSEVLEKGDKVLTEYVNANFESLKGEIVCEYPVSGVRISDDVKIGGRIDRIESLGNRSAAITDLKTGKPKSRNVIEGKTKNSTGDYKRQILFYKLLLDGADSKRWNANKGVIEFVEPDEKGNFHKQEFDYVPEELDELKNEILRVSKEIYNLDFWDKRCGKKDCQYCELRDMINL